MITVRYPTGVSIQYNSATYVVRHANGYTDLYTHKDGKLVAQVPTAECVVEVVAACRVYRATAEPEEIGRSVLDAISHRKLSRQTLVALKSALRGYNVKRGAWR